MLTYNFPYLYELSFKLPPALLWRKNSIRALIHELNRFKLKPQKILDVGCGTGVLIPIVKKLYPTSEILGIDNSKPMIDFAIRRCGKIAKFKVINFFDYKGKHDLIIMFYSFYFFPWTPAIDKIKELLSPSGICIMVTCSRALFSVLHQFYVTKLLKTNVWLYSPHAFYSSFSDAEFSLSSKFLSEIEGSYILSIKKNASSTVKSSVSN
ncbi:MAG: class I SAM-dependent methyltransferase [bacterium]|nr:class I SAM-dependent methyltransferase [bacterium]